MKKTVERVVHPPSAAPIPTTTPYPVERERVRERDKGTGLAPSFAPALTLEQRRLLNARRAPLGEAVVAAGRRFDHIAAAS